MTLGLSILLGGFATCLSLNTWLLMDCEDELKPMEIHIQSASRPKGGNATKMDTYKMYLICGTGNRNDAGKKMSPLFVVAPGMRQPASVGHMT